MDSKKTRNEIEIRDNKYPETSRTNASPTKKRKPPSKQLRDLRRLLEFKCKIKNTLQISQGTQTENLEGNYKQKSKWKFWQKSNSHDRGKYTELNSTAGNEEETELNLETKEKETKEEKIDTNHKPTSTALDPSTIYNNIENAMQLSRLEEPATLLVALRHIIRLNHERGTTISFPQIEAIDRITLKSKNLPTDADNLLTLVNKIFTRRQEKLNLEQIYQQFVRAHGRTIFDFKQQWPACNIHTHQP